MQPTGNFLRASDADRLTKFQNQEHSIVSPSFPFGKVSIPPPAGRQRLDRDVQQTAVHHFSPGDTQSVTRLRSRPSATFGFPQPSRAYALAELHPPDHQRYPPEMAQFSEPPGSRRHPVATTWAVDFDYARDGEMLREAMHESLIEAQTSPMYCPARNPVKAISHWVSNKDVHDQKECSICLTQFNYAERDVVRTKCGHIFHSDCLTPCIQCHSTCPICRASLCEKMC
jgi:E3 ubiquitin-protein ligase ATL6/9/15/31/42/55